jgi:hypothetical protein
MTYTKFKELVDRIETLSELLAHDFQDSLCEATKERIAQRDQAKHELLAFAASRELK